MTPESRCSGGYGSGRARPPRVLSGSRALARGARFHQAPVGNARNALRSDACERPPGGA